jgi:hypothetical protein
LSGFQAWRKWPRFIGTCLHRYSLYFAFSARRVAARAKPSSYNGHRSMNFEAGLASKIQRQMHLSDTCQSPKNFAQNCERCQKIAGTCSLGASIDKPIDNMRKALASAVRKAGILDNGKPAKLTPQVIRRAVLSWHAEAGTAESIAQALCGHARGSRVTQKAYTHHSVEAVARSIIKLPTEEHSENKLAKNLATNGNKQPKRR